MAASFRELLSVNSQAVEEDDEGLDKNKEEKKIKYCLARMLTY